MPGVQLAIIGGMLQIQQTFPTKHTTGNHHQNDCVTIKVKLSSTFSLAMIDRRHVNNMPGITITG